MIDVKLLYKLIKYLKFHKESLIIVMMSLFSVTISLLLIGSAFKELIDKGLSQNHNISINKSILYISLLIIILSIGSFFRSYFINNIAEKIGNQIKQEAYNNLINSEITTFEELKTGDIISRLSFDIDLINKFIINFLSFFIRNFIMLLGGIALMFIQSFKLSLVVVITIPLLSISLISLGKYVKALSKKALISSAIIASDIEESFTNIRAIHAFNQQKNKILSFNSHLTDYLKHSSNRLKIRALFFAISMATIFMSITMVIWIGSNDIVKGNLTAGTMISFIYYAIIAGFSSGGIFELLSEINMPLAAIDRVFALENYVSLPNKKENYQDINVDFKNSLIFLEFANVNFTYKSRPNLKVLNNISFKIEPGKFVGIAGRSGSGKSTLIQLLLKFYTFNSGSIKLANYNISKINSIIIRDLIAYVPQEPSIFSGTISSNITFAKADVSQDEIENIAKLMGITEFTTKMPDGLNTAIGEKGARLSGGQKQRIAIARALICKPEILVLDEAMSALDGESEKKLLNIIRQIMHGKIIISIAHRTSSIDLADNILVIDKGKLVANDTHSNLLLNSETYRLICQEQLAYL